MKKRNPMRMEGVREKVSAKLRAIGWGPTIRKGTGHGMTVHEQLIASAIGWNPVCVKTEVPMGHGYPSCYKVDVGNEALKIAVEIDGNSHKVLCRQQQDRKKEALLKSLGWKVFRFTNEQVEQDVTKCVQEVLCSI
jgi:very-short-patch-repair endonuclease